MAVSPSPVPTPEAENRALLRRAIAFNRDEDIDVTPGSVHFGLDALAQYMTDPEEVWFVKSPKSFLGASGLKPQQIALFEDLVCAMMLHIRQTAERQLDCAIDQAVIGRPVNFRDWAARTPISRRRAFWRAPPAAPVFVTWFSSLNRSPPGLISKRR